MENPKKTNSIKHILKAVASAFVWGLGQVFNKQFVKAIFFFLVMVILVTIELITGSYFIDYNPYSDLEKFSGGTYEDKSAEYGFSDALINVETGLVDRGLKKDDDFIVSYREVKAQNGTYKMEDLVKYTANNLLINNPETFINILTKSKANKETHENTYLRYSILSNDKTDKDYTKYDIKDIISDENTILIPRLETIYVLKETSKIYYQVITGIGSFAVAKYVSVDGEETLTEEEIFGYKVLDENGTKIYTKDDGRTKYKKEIVNQGLSTTTKYQYVNVNNSEDIISEKEFIDCRVLKKNTNLYVNKDFTHTYIEVNDYSSKETEYLELETFVKETYPSHESGKILTSSKDLKKLDIKGNIYLNNGVVYNHYEPHKVGFNQTNFTKNLQKSFEATFNGMGGDRYTKTDFTKFLLRIYFEINEVARKDFEKRFDNFYNDQAGFFVKGLWSVITLGETDREEYTSQLLVYNAIPIVKNDSKFVLESLPIQGHTSTYLLIKGLISTLVLMFFVLVFIWNIRDAYKTSIEYEKTGKRVASKEYFKDLYEDAFEYIVLLPAMIIIIFISIMPIIFSFLIAFTNYKSNVRLVDWVGLENFVSIFSFGKTGDISIPYGTMFWQVLIWTVIWAVASTVTVFFGGFFQALIINNERVPFKKFWRTLLILPWAIPALISQMMFSIIFQETGIINTILNDIGIYDILKDIGILGVPYQEYTSEFLRQFYLGESNIQWFNNPYNKWFVRITLIVVNIWLGFPYYMALMSGVMTSIDKTLYEAAEIDGATKGQRFKYVTFPLVMYSTAPLLVMAFSGNFNNFGMIYFVTAGGAHAGDIAYAYAGDTDILISWMYSLTVDEKIYNMASVFSILIFIVIGSIAAWNYAQTKAFKED